MLDWPLVLESDERVETGEPWKVDVVFYDHDITRFVFWIDAAAGVGHHQDADAHALEHSNRESYLSKKNANVRETSWSKRCMWSKER